MLWARFGAYAALLFRGYYQLFANYYLRLTKYSSLKNLRFLADIHRQKAISTFVCISQIQLVVLQPKTKTYTKNQIKTKINSTKNSNKKQKQANNLGQNSPGY